jgi:hypothetical protein
MVSRRLFHRAVASSLVGLLAACGAFGGSTGRECTLIGCTNSVGFELTGIALGTDFVGSLKARVCFDGACESTEWVQKADGSSRRTNTAIEIISVDDKVQLLLVLPRKTYDTTTEHDTSLTLEVDGHKPVRVERTVRLSRSQPNGAACEPTCWSAHVEQAV